MLKNKLLENNKFVLFISFIIALFIWGYVIIYQSNVDTIVIRDVPITTSYVQSQYKNLGLDVISTSIESVNVSVSGTRSVVGSATADDIVVYPVLTNVTEAGEYTLTLAVDNISTFKDITVDSISSQEVTIYFDKVVTKEFPITIDVSNVGISEDFLSGVIYSNPESVIITGPENEVLKINEVVALTDASENLTQATVLEAELILYDEYKNEIESDVLSFNTQNISVTIPVLKELRLPTKVEYTNIPEGFDINTFTVDIKPKEVVVGVPSTIASTVTEYVVGYIDLKNILLDTPYEFQLEYPAGYMALDNTSNIQVTISSNDIIEKTVQVTDIRVINDSENKIELVTTEINNVVIIGKREAVENLDEGAIIAQIDASKLSLTQGTQTVEPVFIIPSSEEVFVKSTHTITIKN